MQIQTCFCEDSCHFLLSNQGKTQSESSSLSEGIMKCKLHSFQVGVTSLNLVSGFPFPFDAGRQKRHNGPGELFTNAKAKA